MKNIRNTGLVLLAVFIMTAIAGWAAGKGIALVYRGNKISTQVTMINNKPYVPLEDVAKGFGMTLMKKPDGYELAKAGGANQVNGAIQGKVGEELFTGQWKFQVKSVQKVNEYTEKYYASKKTLKPKSKDHVLVVVNCRIKNGITDTVQPMLTERHPGKTALAADNGRSFAPIDFDARQEINKTQSYGAEALLPGAAADFAIVFSVPKDAKLKALVFTAQQYPRDVGGKGTDLRINLESK